MPKIISLHQSQNFLLVLYSGVSVGGVLVLAVLACCIIIIQRRRRSISLAKSKDLGPNYPSIGLPSSNGYQSSQPYTTSPSTNLSPSFPSYPSSKSDFENSASYLGVKVFSYDELEEATEHFNESQELGDGGFGTVYYGMVNTLIISIYFAYLRSCALQL